MLDSDTTYRLFWLMTNGKALSLWLVMVLEASISNVEAFILCMADES
tara:strand:+ start:2369 stop:2509 length:141 start_codon:yes stop_codon:yes gene_type:complete